MGQYTEAWVGGITMTMNVTYTQANAAGGAVVCEISPGAGNEFIIIGYRATCSGTNGIAVDTETATGGTNINRHQAIASGAGTTAYGDLGGSGSNTTAVGAGGVPWPTIISGTQAFKIAQTGAGAQNDTFTVLINIRTRSGNAPTVTHANSTNPANVSATAGTEAFTVP